MVICLDSWLIRPCDTSLIIMCSFEGSRWFSVGAAGRSRKALSHQCLCLRPSRMWQKCSGTCPGWRWPLWWTSRSIPALKGAGLFVLTINSPTDLSDGFILHLSAALMSVSSVQICAEDNSDHCLVDCFRKVVKVPWLFNKPTPKKEESAFVSILINEYYQLNYVSVLIKQAAKGLGIT